MKFLQTIIAAVGSLFRKRPTAAASAVHGEAMQWWTDPGKLQNLSQIFRAHGFGAEADALQARSQLTTTATPQSHADAVCKALKSNNVSAINSLADEFEKSGKGATAEYLRSFAVGVQTANSI